jgi:hypothetical protein
MERWLVRSLKKTGPILYPLRRFFQVRIGGNEMATENGVESTTLPAKGSNRRKEVVSVGSYPVGQQVLDGCMYAHQVAFGHHVRGHHIQHVA